MSARSIFSWKWTSMWRRRDSAPIHTVICSPESPAKFVDENQRRKSSSSISRRSCARTRCQEFSSATTIDENATSFLPGVILVALVPRVVLVRLLPGVILVRLARRDIVDVRNHIVRRVVVQGERAARVLQWDGSTRAFGLLLLRFRAPETLRLRVGAEVAASWRDRRRGVGRTGAAERRRGARTE